MPKQSNGKNGPQAAAQEPSGKIPNSQASGLDVDRHQQTQESARGAELLREGIYPALMASGLQLDKFVNTPAFRVFLERLFADAGSPRNPIARMMVEQLALTHFRIAQIQIQAAHAEGLDAAKIYNSMASRLLGEFRRSALALDLVSSRSTERTAKARLQLFREAQ